MRLRYQVIVRVGDKLLHQKDYKCYKEISSDLCLTYQQVADIAVGRSKQFHSNFKYSPQIVINKISPSYYNGEKEGKGEEEASITQTAVSSSV